MPKKSKTKLVDVLKVAPQSLKIGDIVFFYDYRINEHDERYEKEFISHVAIVCRYEKGIPFIAHATFSKKRSSKKNKVELTPLRPFTNYLILRYQHEDLAQKAATIANNIVNMTIPYDVGRLASMTSFLESITSLDDGLEQNNQQFKNRAYLQPWKYWLRYRDKQQLFRDESLHGFRCDQFVITCFQMALCETFNEFTFAKTSHSFWPSLKSTNHSSDLINLQQQLYDDAISDEASTTHQQDPNDRPVACSFKSFVGRDLLQEQAIPYSSKTKSSPSILLHFLTQFDYGDGGRPENTPPFQVIGMIMPNQDKIGNHITDIQLPHQQIKISLETTRPAKRKKVMSAKRAPIIPQALIIQHQVVKRDATDFSEVTLLSQKTLDGMYGIDQWMETSLNHAFFSLGHQLAQTRKTQQTKSRRKHPKQKHTKLTLSVRKKLKIKRPQRQRGFARR
ncbi:MAG: hypothetical protein ACON5A_03685 [Candidatus Comchoanobacterales bacterium]